MNALENDPTFTVVFLILFLLALVAVGRGYR